MPWLAAVVLGAAVAACWVWWPKIQPWAQPWISKLTSIFDRTPPAAPTTPTPTPTPHTLTGTDGVDTSTTVGKGSTQSTTTVTIRPPVSTPTPPPKATPPPPLTDPKVLALIVGSWRGGRHLTEFRADGTFVLDADIVPEPATGIWTITGSFLTQTFREGNQITQNIDGISDQEMLTSDPKTGQVFTLKRENTARVHFDTLNPGRITGDEFKGRGLRLTTPQGNLMIVAAPTPPMVMPDGHRHLLMVNAGLANEFALEFNPPVKSFTITLPGLTGGSSFPTYSVTSYDAAGVGFDKIGQEHWVPKVPNPLIIVVDSGRMISRAVIAVDNRFGKTAWATYNSLPIVQIELRR